MKIKCFFCKGQNNNSRETLYLYNTGTYWCARCKAYGAIKDLPQSVVADFKIIPKEFTQLQTISYNNLGNRFSTCKQRHFDSNVDIFQIKDVDGSLVGHYHRFPEKRSKTVGKRLFSYRDSHLKLGGTYRLVEGVYDCVYPEDVALNGTPSKEQAKKLKHYNLILCPDGDVWHNKELFVSWFKPFVYSSIVGVEYVGKDKDPDEVTKDQRQLVNWRTVREKLWTLKN